MNKKTKLTSIKLELKNLNKIYKKSNSLRERIDFEIKDLTKKVDFVSSKAEVDYLNEHIEHIKYELKIEEHKNLEFERRIKLVSDAYLKTLFKKWKNLIINLVSTYLEINKINLLWIISFFFNNYVEETAYTK